LRAPHRLHESVRRLLLHDLLRDRAADSSVRPVLRGEHRSFAEPMRKSSFPFRGSGPYTRTPFEARARSRDSILFRGFWLRSSCTLLAYTHALLSRVIRTQSLSRHARLRSRQFTPRTLLSQPTDSASRRSTLSSCCKTCGPTPPRCGHPLLIDLSA
jgi:hypothetical protein